MKLLFILFLFLTSCSYNVLYNGEKESVIVNGSAFSKHKAPYVKITTQSGLVIESYNYNAESPSPSFSSGLKQAALAKIGADNIKLP